MRIPKLSIPPRVTSAIMAIAIGLVTAFLTLHAEDIEVELRVQSRIRQLRLKHNDSFDPSLLKNPSIIKDMRDTVRKKSALPQFFTTLDTRAYDWQFQQRGPHSVSPDRADSLEAGTAVSEVVIIQISENALQNLKNPSPTMQQYQSDYPFKRQIYGELLRKLKSAGATVVGLDLTFSDPSKYNSSDKDMSDDREFAKALKECGNVVLAVKRIVSYNRVATFEASASSFPINVQGARILDSARCARPVDVTQDNLDNAIRRFEPSVAFYDPEQPDKRRDYPNFAVELAALYANNQKAGQPKFQDIPEEQFQSSLLKELESNRFEGHQLIYHRQDIQSSVQGGGEEAQKAPTPIEKQISQSLEPLGFDRSINICYAGFPIDSPATKGFTCSHYDFDEVLKPENEARLKQWFNNKIVLVGSVLPEEQDYYATPLTYASTDDLSTDTESRRFGVEVHASIIHTLLSHHFYAAVPENTRLALVWLCALLTALFVYRLKPLLALIPVILLMSIILIVTGIAFKNYYVLHPTHILAAASFSYLFETVYFYAVEERRAHKARSRFSRYVGPQVLTKILDTDFRFGSVEKRYVAILFSDVQGFTSLSEKIDPGEAVVLLNRYLNEMVDIIYKHGGTLDKIMGDGVMAYFGALPPLAKPEAAAVQCALEMQRAMKLWREASENAGVPALKIRIGIHAGEVVVGEIGAKKQLGYTIIGDAVNIAARLEPLNKKFESEILVSQAIKDKLDTTFQTVFMGELEIRGREEGILAYSIQDDSHGAVET